VSCSDATGRYKNIYLSSHKIGCQIRQSVILPLGPAVLNRDILPFSKAQFCEAVPEG
jgi:hypothetical protein